MAQRINVSIPDPLAERLEAYKDRISPSEIFQQAINQRIDQLEALDNAQSVNERIRQLALNYMENNESSIVKEAKKAADYYFRSEKDAAILLDLFFHLKRMSDSDTPHMEDLNELSPQFFDYCGLHKACQAEYLKEFSRIVVEKLEEVLDKDELVRLL